jgi:hypothetical protein
MTATWLYEDKEVQSHDDLHPKCVAIVYCITYTNDCRYYGKKVVRSLRKYPPLKGKKRVRRKLKNIPFASYEGSHEIPEGLEICRKEILYQCSSQKTATFLEAALLFYFDALANPGILNDNILGKFFPKDYEGLL